ncbi:MAG: hypothetical protein AMS27_12960 [Bacteroides sp. SM23_62_1]|nr:MAG: hypothetical protein AMS27_12960 [Bacteroides sp. SM23_62_1]
MKKTVLTFLIICFSAAFVSSNDPVSTELFPDVEGWKLTVNERIYIPSNLWDLIDGAADSYLSYDFIDLHLADYQNDAGINIRVELYRHSTFNNTFGIYTTERSPDYNFIDIGSQGYLEEGALNFLCGNYYIKVTTSSQGDNAQKALVKIAKNMQQHLQQDHNWPGIYKIFPPGMVPYSEYYIAENFLGFDFLHSAFTASYKEDGEDFQVFVIRTEKSEEVSEMLRKYLKFTKQELEVKDGTFLISDPYNGDIYTILKGNTLAGIVDCSDEKTVKEYLEKLNSKL